MPAAVAIPAIIGAAGVGAQLVGAKMASGASGRAARLQVNSADRAQQFNQQAYADQQRAMSPYMQAGQQALGGLMSNYGGKALSNPYAPQGMSTQGQPLYGGMSSQPPEQPQGPPQGASGPPQGAPMAPTQGMAPQGQPQGGGVVRVKAPTGEMAQFPEGSPGLQQALQRGAVRF